MKIAIFSTIALWAATLPAVTANFDIYWVHQDLYDTMIWMVFAAPPSCDEVNHTRGWGWKSDVSGNKYGMRCQGNGCGAFKRPEEIDVLEMNFNDNPQYHWTLYANRGWTMVGLNGQEYGDCFVFTEGDFDCPGGMQGHRKFRCLTSFTAGTLNSNTKSAPHFS